MFERIVLRFHLMMDGMVHKRCVVFHWLSQMLKIVLTKIVDRCQIQVVVVAHISQKVGVRLRWCVTMLFGSLEILLATWSVK